MNKSSRLLPSPVVLFLLFLISSIGVEPSNPDSEVVQDNEEEEVVMIGGGGGATSGQKSASMLADNQWRSYGDGRIRLMKPIVTSTGVIWREVGAMYDGLSKKKDRTVLYKLYSDSRGNGGSTKEDGDDNRGGRPSSGNRPSSSNGVPEDGTGSDRNVLIMTSSARLAPSGRGWGSGRISGGNVPQQDTRVDSVSPQQEAAGGASSPQQGTRGGGIPPQPEAFGGAGAAQQGTRSGGIPPQPEAFGGARVPQPGNRGGGIPPQPEAFGGAGAAQQGTRGGGIPPQPEAFGGARIPQQGNRRGGGIPPQPEAFGGARIPQRGTRGGGIPPQSASFGGAGGLRQGTRVRGIPPRPVAFAAPQQGTRNSGFRQQGATGSGASQEAWVPNYPSATNNTDNGGFAPAKADMNLFAGMVNDFAFRITEVLSPRSNFVISPISVFIAVAMCYMGSEGRTRTQLERVLGLDENLVHGLHLHQGIKDLVVTMSQDKRQLQVLVANGLFLAQNLSVDERYRDELQTYYLADLENVDFSNPILTLSLINRWVSRNTQNAIPTLMDRSPPPLTRLLLLNAVYFRGLWKKQFPENLTYKGQFRTADGKTKEVPTMALYGESFPFHRSDEHRHTFVKLSYAGDQISMVVALPYSADVRPMSFPVRDRTLCHVLDAMRNTTLGTLALPKFRIEDVHSLRRALVQMGAGYLFDRNNVDLSRMRRQNDVYVSEVLQKVLVEADERGTTAAAVTGVRFVPLSIGYSTDFVVDRPFAFFVVHESSGLVLFHGRIDDLGVEAPSTGGNRTPVRRRPNFAAIPEAPPGGEDDNSNRNETLAPDVTTSGVTLENAK